MATNVEENKSEGGITEKPWGGQEGLTEGGHGSKDPREVKDRVKGDLDEGTARTEALRQSGRARRPGCMDLRDQGTGDHRRAEGNGPGQRAL